MAQVQNPEFDALSWHVVLRSRTNENDSTLSIEPTVTGLVYVFADDEGGKGAIAFEASRARVAAWLRLSLNAVLTEVAVNPRNDDPDWLKREAEGGPR